MCVYMCFPEDGVESSPHAPPATLNVSSDVHEGATHMDTHNQHGCLGFILTKLTAVQCVEAYGERYGGP